MTFICTIADGQFHADFFSKGESRSVICPVGHDPAKEANYFVNVGLDKTGGGITEYYFHVVEVFADKDEVTYWSGIDLPDEIDRDCRKLILAAVLQSTEALLNQAKPKSVFRCTRDTNPPEKSLEKHYLISDVFVKCGYKVEVADEYQGKRSWWAEL